MTQLRIPALYMRGGTSKGLFFKRSDLPADPALRDRLLLRLVGSPDPYGKHTDGMGGATSSTSKVVILAPSDRDDSDIDYLFGQVAIDAPLIDWSGNCGNLSAAVAPAAIAMGLLDAPQDGELLVRIWQANIGKRIHASIKLAGGEPVEEGDFELDGVAFPAGEMPITFLDPVSDDEPMFPTGRIIELLTVPGIGEIEVTMLSAGLPTVFVDAASLGLRGTEHQAEINSSAELLARVEAIRCHAAVVMGLATSPQQSTRERPHVPKVCFVAAPAAYTASSGKAVAATDINLLARIFSMGVLHHAMTGTGAVAIAVAAAIPDTLVHRASTAGSAGKIRFGHPSGTLLVGAEVRQQNNRWIATKVVMSRSARRLMEGWVRVPADTIDQFRSHK